MRRTEQGGIFFRLLFLIVFCACVAVIYFARYPLMRFAGESWVLDDPAAPSDALIVLGDDNYAADRAFHAADLYREGVARTVVASGRLLRQNVGLADVMEHDLESFGVPGNAIVKLSTRAQNTKDEAVEVARLIESRKWKRVTIVTSNYHARRAKFIYSRTLPPAVEFRVSGARDSEFDPTRWWESRQGQKLFFSELAGYVVARWELRAQPSSENHAAVVRLWGARSLRFLQGWDLWFYFVKKEIGTDQQMRRAMVGWSSPPNPTLAQIARIGHPQP